ncbi:MAG: transposase [Candidatus Caldatribacteriota bacterium]|nr:transposase [Candidatus Caldatribacteriota bacterium]
MFQKKYKDLNDLVIIFEATGAYSNYLKEFCASYNLKVYIINPKRSSNFSKAIGNRSKTDKIDTKKTIYEYRKIIDPKNIKVPKIDKVAQTLSAYLTSYKFTVKKRVSISNHLEALKGNTYPPLELVPY